MFFMKIDDYYTLEEIKKSGLTEKQITNINYHVFQKNGNIYFFEKKEKKYQLYSKTNKESFFF